MTQKYAARAKPVGRAGHLGQKLALAVFSVIGFLAAAELVARVVVPPPPHLAGAPIQADHEALIVALGLPGLNETMEYSPSLFWRLKERLVDFRVRGAIRGHPIDFTVSTWDHLRSPKVAASKDKLRLLAVGDSTTFGLGVDDDETWPAQLQRLFDGSSLEVEVINAGVPGYSSFQCRRFLEERGMAMQPDIVVATFGFNDFDRWATARDTEAARAARLREWNDTLTRSRFYYGMQRLLRIDSAAASGAGMEPLARAVAGLVEHQTRLTLDEYTDQVRTIKRLCDDRGIPLILLLWPAEIQVRTKHHSLEDYQRITQEIAARLGIPTIDLVTPFIHSDRPLFLDRVHANETGLRITAERVYLEVAPRLERASRGD